MKLAIYQIDAFTSQVFSGNPAAIIPLGAWLDDQVMQSIAMENNLSETAFYIPAGDGFALRWFTPEYEVDLCGHATLAAASLLFSQMGFAGDEIRFSTRSGNLTVKRQGRKLSMDFPVLGFMPCDSPEVLSTGLGIEVEEVYADMDYMVVVRDEKIVAELQPDFSILKKIDKRGVIVTAPGDNCDFVSRFFAPGAGVDEDPVTGSAHCMLTAYWAKRLEKMQLKAHQISLRGGELECELAAERVLLKGEAALYLKGEIYIS